MSDIVFLDCETLGLDLDAPIWEVAAIRRNGDTGAETELHLFVHHNPAPWSQQLPDVFRQDYYNRFDDGEAVTDDEAAHRVREFLDGRPHIAGAVPSFDTERIAHQWLRPHGFDLPWHYHLIDVESLIVGYLVGVGKQAVNDGELDSIDLSKVAPPWKSDHLSRIVGVDPENFDRHTAMGDVLWVKAQYDVVMGHQKVAQ